MGVFKWPLAFMTACSLSFQFSPIATAETSGPKEGDTHQAIGGCGGVTSPFNKSEIEQWAREELKDKADCYMKLFENESSVNPMCQNQKVPNPPGMGLCMLEGQANQRKARGEECGKEDSSFSGVTQAGVKQQMKCCQEIMKKTPEYFEKVKHHELKNCEGQG